MNTSQKRKIILVKTKTFTQIKSGLKNKLVSNYVDVHV